MTLNSDARSLENWMHARVAKAFRVTTLSDFEAGVLSKGYVTREDYEEAYRLYVEKMTASGFIVETIVDDSGYYVRNYSSRRMNELFSRGDSPASEVSRLDEEERSLSQGCEVGTFQLISTIFREQSEPSSQFDD
ncbi:hypothetical protein NIBR502772_10440 [Pseudarthrobacter sp. NIBRBAC000502772]|uniref:hypothetical protein n=1 Tax=Pseudarthrobacter sp. NIBRBAC000502772 TaxID=2590775 RepID=UPI00113085C1|nr:hypothetical protein [Pseudarthrobacter sp. NIBRBAC000502772]QDG66574.1 hypothetical protein NIBR502772_10440 [Pseudarthrobacter sp. NIBRBAC000502772]